MGRLIVMLAVVGLSLGTARADDDGYAPAGPVPGPLCGRPEVLEVLADILAKRGSPARIVPDSTNEVSRAGSDRAYCALLLELDEFLPTSGGPVLQPGLAVLDYNVRRGARALFVEARPGYRRY